MLCVHVPLLLYVLGREEAALVPITDNIKVK